MTGYRRAQQPRADHEAAAQMARRSPGEWVLATTYPAAGTAQNMAQKVQAGTVGAYGDGVWQARTRPAADSTTALYVRYVGCAGEQGPRRPQLTVDVDVTGLRGVLRVDAIQRDTIVGLARDWDEQDNWGTPKSDDVVDALGALAVVLKSPRDEHETDAAVEAVVDAGELDWAQVSLNLDELIAMRQRLDWAISKVARFNPSRDDGGDAEVTELVYRQRDGRDAA